MGFLIEATIGGLMAGMLYSLVALGFVLIFKASGVFNFAQGAMVLFAALSLVRLMEQMPFAAALAATCAIMVVLAFLIERLVLRPLVNQEGVALLMATLGVTYFLDGFGQTVWGSNVYKINLGIGKEPVMVLESVFQGGLLVNKEDFAAALVAAALVTPAARGRARTPRPISPRSSFRAWPGGARARYAGMPVRQRGAAPRQAMERWQAPAAAPAGH